MMWVAQCGLDGAEGYGASSVSSGTKLASQKKGAGSEDFISWPLYVCPDVGGHSNYTMDGFGQNKTSFPFGFSVSNLLGQEPKKK
jgi:hypothetical protein